MEKGCPHWRRKPPATLASQITWQSSGYPRVKGLQGQPWPHPAKDGAAQEAGLGEGLHPGCPPAQKIPVEKGLEAVSRACSVEPWMWPEV
jgi:hypothetical protein